MISEVNRLLQVDDRNRDYTREIQKLIDFVSINKGKPVDKVVDGIQIILLASTKTFYSVQACQEIYKKLQ